MRSSHLAAALIFAVVAGACSSSTSAPPGATTPDGVTVRQVGCDDVERTFVGRERALPDGHVQLDVFPIAADGSRVGATECVTVRDQGTGERLESAVVAGSTDRRLLAVVIDPGRNQAERDRAVELVEALAAAAPTAELALYRWGPVDDPLAAPVPHIDSTSTWSVATDAGAVADNWRESRFELSGAFEAVDPATITWPAASDPTAPLLGRSTFEVFELGVDDAELEIDHTHGVRVWINGAEVATSNVTETGAVADTGTGQREVQTTVPAEVLQSGTNVLAIEMARSANGDPPEVRARLTGTSSQVAPVAALAPNRSATALDRSALASLAPTSTTPGRLEDVSTSVIEDLERTHDDETDAVRSVVFVAPSSSAPDFKLDGRADAVMIWVGDSDDPVSGLIDWTVDADAPPDDVAATVTSGLDAVAASRLIIGMCSPGARTEAEVEVGVVNLSTTVREPPPENQGGPCDAEAAAQATPEAVDDVGLVFDDAARAVWAQRVAANDKSPFRAAVDLGHGWGPTPAEISLRGQSSLECDRKSYSVNLDTGHRRHIAEETAFDEFFLVSMCLDEGFVRTHSMLTVLADRGLFPPGFRMVRLDIDDQPAGLYLLVEPPAEALRDAQPQLDGVVRRALDTSFQESSVAWSSVDRDDVVLSAYESTITTAEAGGPDVLAEVAGRLDLTAYLRWLAIMSMTDNGDYVDEVFFSGVGVADGPAVAPYWTPMGWDPDDIFSPCHFDDFQFVDPSGLSTCAEARIDHALLSTDAGYGAYVDTLGQVLGELTPDDFAAALAGTGARMAQLLDDDTAAAMPELQALTGLDTSTAAGFLGAVEAEIDALEQAFGTRHAALTSEVATRGGDGAPAAPAPLEAMVPTRVLAGQESAARIAARGPDGVDRSRTDSVTVRLVEETTLPLRRGVAVVELPAVLLDGTPLVLAGDEVATVTVVDEPDRIAPRRIDEPVRWGPDEVVQLDRSVLIGPAGSLVIEPGTTLAVGPGVNIDVRGQLQAAGTVEAPVLVADLDPAAPWGGVRANGGTVELDHTIITGGGGDADRAFGHSDSQPVLAGQSGATVNVTNSVIADSTGKAFGLDATDLTLADTIVTRTDTGGEMVNGTFAVADSWFLDFPTVDAPVVDDDNDALYLGLTREPGTITNTVFIGGIDDGIDHAGADVSIDRAWIEGFSHECLATSEGGSVTITNSVLQGCEQGLEVGYGTPTVRASHLLLMANGSALRYGDDYFVASEGSFELTDSLLIDNVAGLEVSTEPAALTVSGSVSDDPGDEDAGLLIDSPQLNDALVWEAGGPAAPGLEQGWP